MGLLKSCLRGLSELSKEHKRAKRFVDGCLKVINESLEHCRSSKNPETRISRMGVAIDRLDHLCNEQPNWPDVNKWQEQKAKLKREYPSFVMDNLTDFIDEETAKIDALKSDSARQNRARKLIEKLQPYKRHPACKSSWISSQIIELKQAYNVSNEPAEQQEPVQSLKEKREAQPLMYTTQLVSEIKSTKPVSFWGKTGIWFCWVILCSPLIQKPAPYNTIGLIISIVLAVVTVKWIHRRREQRVNNP